MKLQELRLEVRILLGRFESDARMAASLEDASFRTLSELFYLDLFRELFQLPDLEDLNKNGGNFPGLDLGDKTKGVAFQITVDPDPEKVKDCLRKVLKFELHVTFPKVRVFVQTGRADSYQQKAINKITDGKLAFNCKTDVLDYRDLGVAARKCELSHLERVILILRRHLPREESRSGRAEIEDARELEYTRRFDLTFRLSGFQEGAANDRLRILAIEVIDGHVGLGAPLKRQILLRAARSSALKQQVAEAERFLAAAQEVRGESSDVCARARIAEAKGDEQEAIRLLRDETDADARSTLLGIIGRKNGADAALQWMKDTGLKISELTANGLVFFCQIRLMQGDVVELARDLDGIIDSQIDGSPYALLMRAKAKLASVFAEPDQLALVHEVPLDVRFLAPVLRSADVGAKLDAAIEDFVAALPLLRGLGLVDTVRSAQAFLTWAELLHPAKQESAATRLRSQIGDIAGSFHLLQFAFAFDSGFDPSPSRAWLTRREANGGWNDAELKAALIFRIHGSSPEDVAGLIAKYRARFQRILSPTLVLLIEVQALSLAKDATTARARFEEGKSILELPLAIRLEAEVEKAEGADPIAAQLAAYEKSESVETLRALVVALVGKDDVRIGRYAEKLYALTKDPRDIALSAQSFADSGERDEFMRLVRTHRSVLDDDVRIKRKYGWELFASGKLQEAEQIAKELNESGGRDFNLEVALYVDSGQWDQIALPLYWLLDRTPKAKGLELIRAAHLAHAAGVGPVQQLINAAVIASPEDPKVLIGAYHCGRSGLGRGAAQGS